MRTSRNSAGLSWVPLAALVAVACSKGDGAARPRNAILISIDTLRPDHLSCYGHEPETSPALDELAAEGVRFADVTSAAPWTLPAHATMLTGLYPSHHGVKTHETRLPESTVTLAEEFRDHGFRTLAVVNTHNVGAPQFQLRQGFERFRYIRESEDGSEVHTHNSGEEIVATAKELLEGTERTKPFFLFLHFYDVHTDFTPGDEYRNRFVAPYGGHLKGQSEELHRIRMQGDALDEADLRFLREMYDAEIRQLDDVLARFFAWLGEQGELEDTLVFVTSDHGEEFLEHGGLLHGTTHYEELLRIPWIVRGPGVPRGTVVDEPVHGVDVAPTLLGLMGIESSAPHDGLDVSVLWRGGALPERVFFGEADHNNRVDGKEVTDIKRMVRRGADKLHWNRVTGRYELYDLGADPGERRDVFADRPDVAERLRAELERFQASEVRGEAVPPPESAEELQRAEEERELLKGLGY